MKVQDMNQNFSFFLKATLKERCLKNPNYSLRSFAKHLSTDASLLSKLINGKRKVTPKQIDKLGEKLNLNPKMISHFKNNVISQSHSSEPSTTVDYQKISLEYFEVISAWQHYAILELMKLSFFKEDHSWIGATLGISTKLVTESVKRLQEVGLLEIDSNGKWNDLSEGSSTHIIDKNITSYAHKIAQKKILQRASDALDGIDIEKRDQSSMLLASHPSKVLEAKDKISKFRRELTEFLEDTEEKTELYQMSFSVFPLIDKD